MFHSCSATTRFTPMHDAFVALRVVNNLLDQVFVCQVPAHCIDQQHNILMSITNVNIVIHFWASQNTPFGSQGTELWEPNIYICVPCLKAVYNSCKLQWLLQAAKFFFMYSFTPANILFLFRHLLTKIVIFINVCYQIKCFRGDRFSFFRSGFANISPTFLISCDVQTRYSKTLRYSEQYIRDHLSGIKVKISICSEYDAVSNFFALSRAA